jgi:protein-S-isoprenylcysteine O-methyltransferase Ste14
MTITFATRFVAYVMLVLACLLGGGTLLVFVLFLFTGSLNLVSLNLGKTSALWFDACLCLAFFVQHSGMVRKSFRQRLARFLPAQYDGAVYAIASGVVLLILVVLWQKTAITLIEPHVIARWLPRAVYFLSIAGIAWGIWALGFFDPFGYKPILDHLRGSNPPQVPLFVRGPFRWVRHPLYFFFLLMIWSCPYLTADRLLFNVLWTAWIIVGTVLEDRDLLATYGEAYRSYQRKVPMLFPWYIHPAR